jgi:hypothetical protein
MVVALLRRGSRMRVEHRLHGVPYSVAYTDSITSACTAEQPPML